MTERRSLRDRNRAAIAQDPAATRPAAPAEDPAPAPRRRRATPTGRIGVYLTPDEFTAAKAAYLSDWQHGGQADSFARWVSAAITTHARRTPADRARLARPRARSERRTGASRTFPITSDAQAAMRTAISADQQADHWSTDSAWIGDAITAATAAARAAAGGTLPPAPDRLPNRLTR